MDLTKLIKFQIGEKVKVRRDCQHDIKYIGKIGEVVEHVILDHLEYYVEFDNGTCRFSLNELQKLSDEEVKAITVKEELKSILADVGMIDTSKADYLNRKYKLDAIGKIQSLIKSL